MKTTPYYSRLILTLFFISTWSLMNAQQVTYLIQGKITDNTTKETLPGVNVVVKGTVAGTISKPDGSFELKTAHALPFTLVVSFIGFETQEFEIKEAAQNLQIALNTQSHLIDHVVVSASRVEESTLTSPVSIEKLDITAIKTSPAPSFFDAIENVKGVQMTTLSLGFKVPNTRGFSGTTNSRFLQLVDGVDVTSPGIGAPVANTVGPTELDIQSVELIPGAASAIYGMNAISGISSLKTKSPFEYQGLGFYQKTGLNHIDGKFTSPKLFTETALRYARSFKDKFAFKINVSYFKGYDWVADNHRDLQPAVNSSVGLTGDLNPGTDPINSYGNENQNRKDIKLGDGKTYQIARTGYYEKDFLDYNVENLKADIGLFYRLNEKAEISYSYRIGKSDNVYQRGNRIKLDDLFIQQHKMELKGANYFLRTYATFENTGKSYNARPMGENLDRNFKSDTDWFNDYKNAFNAALANGQSVSDAHSAARVSADAGRYQPGTAEFDAKVKELAAINNWDKGAALIIRSSFYHAEGQYDWSKQVKFIDILTGFDAREYVIQPDGNSFINPDGLQDSAKLYDKLYYGKVGGFVQLTKRLFNDRFKIIASARVDKQQYFDAKFNPRIAAVLTLKKNHNFRVSYQNGFRFPTLFEGFSFVDNGGVKRLGGVKLLSQSLNIHENSYLRTSQQAFNTAVRNDLNNGLTEEQAIENNKNLLVKSDYGFIKPEHINSFEIGYKAIVFDKRIFIDADYYFNIYKDFIGQVEVARIDKGTIGVDDSTAYYARTSSPYANNTRFRLWTNSTSITTNQGASLGITYNFYKTFTVAANGSWSQLSSVNSADGLIPAFNTPEFITNVSFGNRELFKNFGFNITWRWQDAFYWDSPLATGTISAYNTLDAQVSYRFMKGKASAKLGAANLLNHRYYQYEGGPTIGGMYYLTLAFDGLLN